MWRLLVFESNYLFFIFEKVNIYKVYVLLNYPFEFD